MILSARVSPSDSIVELRRGEHVIIARVVWQEGGRVGLQSADRVPVEEIMSSHTAQPQRLGDGGRPIERRRHPRDASSARIRGRVMEFVAVGLIGASLASAAWLVAEQALARPMALVASALGR